MIGWSQHTLPVWKFLIREDDIVGQQPLAHYLAYVTVARAGFPGAFRAEEDTQQSPQNAQCLQTCP